MSDNEFHDRRVKIGENVGHNLRYARAVCEISPEKFCEGIWKNVSSLAALESGKTQELLETRWHNVRMRLNALMGGPGFPGHRLDMPPQEFRAYVFRMLLRAHDHGRDEGEPVDASFEVEDDPKPTWRQRLRAWWDEFSNPGDTENP